MLHACLLLALTFGSSFLAADTLNHLTGRLQAEKSAVALLGLWIAAVVLTVLDGDWLTTLGVAHVVLYLAAAWVMAKRHPHVGVLEHDYIKYPVLGFVPAFLVLYILG